MTPAKITAEGAIWFFSNRNSKKNEEITTNPQVQLIFSNSIKGEFLNIFGRAEIIEDKSLMEDCWKSDFTEWFPLGLNDPDLTLIKITPHLINYWDMMHHKMCEVIQSALPELAATIKETLTV
jgi:general stress protein 26